MQVEALVRNNEWTAFNARLSIFKMQWTALIARFSIFKMQWTEFNAGLSILSKDAKNSIQCKTKHSNRSNNYQHCWPNKFGSCCVRLHASLETQGQSVGSGKKAGRKFSLRAKEPLGTDSHRTISKNSSGCRLLIGHKKCFVLLCLIGEQFLLSSFREFVHDGYCLDTLARFVHQACAHKGNYRPYHGFRRHLDG